MFSIVFSSSKTEEKKTTTLSILTLKKKTTRTISTVKKKNDCDERNNDAKNDNDAKTFYEKNSNDFWHAKKKNEKKTKHFLTSTIKKLKQILTTRNNRVKNLIVDKNKRRKLHKKSVELASLIFCSSMWVFILSILSFNNLYLCHQCLISRFKIVIRVNDTFICVYSRVFTILILLIMLISFFFSCNMSNFEKFDCDVENLESSLKVNHKIWFVDCKNDISFNVKFFIVEKLLANKTKSLLE